MRRKTKDSHKPQKANFIFTVSKFINIYYILHADRLERGHQQRYENEGKAERNRSGLLKAKDSH